MREQGHRLSGLALAGAALGLTCAGGPLALFLSLHALRAINASDGRLRGRPLAVAGLALGALGSLLLALGLAAVVLMPMREASNRADCTNNLRLIGLAVGQ